MEDMINKMEIIVIDGQGGGIGRSVIEAIKTNIQDSFVIGIGTNSIATNNLKKGGADAIATGQNAIVYNSATAKIIIGPIGICFANAMYGEISPTMAKAINESEATKYLIPISKCNVRVAGVIQKTMSEYIDEIIKMIQG